jgi:methionine sulfoxide reductase heme-binding subunit
VVLRAGPRHASVLAWLLGLYPLALLAWWLRHGLGGLGANPIERLLHHTGWWALVLLLATLSITPARRVTGLSSLIRSRRPLGLFAFFYATLHLAVYVALDQALGWGYLVEDLLERPFITVGFLAWLLLLPLAITSTRGWIVRLGRRWARLHTLVYLATGLGILHYYWRVRADTRLPVLFALVLVVLLAVRIRWWSARRWAPNARGRHARHGPE